MTATAADAADTWWMTRLEGAVAANSIYVDGLHRQIRAVHHYLATVDPDTKTSTQVLADVHALLPAIPETPARNSVGAKSKEKQS